jgi:L-ribulokinase
MTKHHAAATGRAFSLGVDYGTNSVRALIVDAADGREIASAVFDYPSGKAGILLDPRDPNLARQDPGDYIRGFEVAVQQAVAAAQATAEQSSFDPAKIVGIGVDTTGSTPLPVDAGGTPLAMLPQFKGNLAAQAWLWKDHTSFAEAAEITELAKKRGEPYLAKCGGTYSSEWFWSKILHCLRTDPQVFAAAHSWVECADFIPAWITGHAKPAFIRRGICAAGHKAMFHPQWGGLPSKDFLAALDPKLAALRDRLFDEALPSNHKAGELTPEFAAKVGLPAGLPVAVGALDAHFGAVGAGAGPGTLVKIMGTSTCDIMAAPDDGKTADVPGLCGIVPGSVIPGMLGLEAGQSAVGDIFNWFVGQLSPQGKSHGELTQEAARLQPGESGLLALDWNNGNRTILVDPLLTGLLVGQTLHTTAGEVYRALIEATAFGALTIINRMEEYGVKVAAVVNCGGIAEKNPMAMQIYADICNRPMKVSRSGQTCALGAAVFGAVVGGAHPDTAAAQKAMTGVKEKVFTPAPQAVAVYAQLYTLYRKLHDAFGTRGYTGSLFEVMKDLIALRNRVRQGG